MALAHYSPEDVVVTIAGMIPLTGFIDGTFISIEKNKIDYKPYISADGRVSRTYVNDQTYNVKLNLHSMSETNDVLTKIWMIDQVTQKAKFPLFIKDTLGSTLFVATTCWVEKIADVNFSTDVDTVTWNIFAAQAVLNVGGNSSESGLMDDLVETLLGSVPAIGRIL